MNLHSTLCLIFWSSRIKCGLWLKAACLALIQQIHIIQDPDLSLAFLHITWKCYLVLMPCIIKCYKILWPFRSFLERAMLAIRRGESLKTPDVRTVDTWISSPLDLSSVRSVPDQRREWKQPWNPRAQQQKDRLEWSTQNIWLLWSNGMVCSWHITHADYRSQRNWFLNCLDSTKAYLETGVTQCWLPQRRAAYKVCIRM